MTHSFSRVPQIEIPRSTFDRSHGVKTTFDAGYLVPILCDETLPGDTFSCSFDAFARLATPINPIMDNMFMETFFFHVPYRIIWDNFTKMMGEQENPTDSIDFTVPTINSLSIPIGDIKDYFGLPIVGQNDVSALPLRAYNLIYNEWFRDQNLQNSVTVNKTDTDSESNYSLLRRGKRHDYFTSCLPWPQKGGATAIPISGSAPLIGLGLTSAAQPTTITAVNETSNANVTYQYGIQVPLGTTGAGVGLDTIVAKMGATTGSNPEFYADLDAVSATISDLRQAFQVQRLLERDARSGTRYVELIRSHFGIKNAGGDARLQRPEYLGGGSTPINITPIAQTSETGTTPQGNLSAIGTAAPRNHGFTKSFTEHGIVIGLINVRADLTYQQGTHKMWKRSTRYDFYYPTLAHLGEQAVLRSEIYTDGTSNDDLVFGYQERWAEYRYKPSTITGLFRSVAVGTLHSWHLSEQFLSAPQLNSTFIESNPPVDRCIAVPSEPHFILDGYFRYRCTRPMPVFGVPGLIDHF